MQDQLSYLQQHLGGVQYCILIAQMLLTAWINCGFSIFDFQ